LSERQLDWPAIRAGYEEGSSLSALERQHSVSRQAIKKRAIKELWSAAPEQQQLQGTVTGNTQGVINRDVNAAVRVTEAIKNRQAGWTYERIAAQCGYANPGAARNAIQNELDRVIVQEVEEWRNDHISRLEKLHEEVWELATNKANKGRLFAIDRLLAIAEREAKLLGLDAKPDEASVPQIIIEEVPMGYLSGGPSV
jgi:hypothetical protein